MAFRDETNAERLAELRDKFGRYDDHLAAVEEEKRLRAAEIARAEAEAQRAKDEEPDESCEASCATERMSLISNASKCVAAAPLAALAHPAHRRTSLSLPQAPPLGDPPRSAIRQHPILQAGGE